MTASRRAILRLARVLAARGGVFVVALAVILGVVRGGARYFYCPMMGQAFDDACCASAEAHDDDDRAGPAFERPACCQAKRLGTLPTGATVSTIDVPAVPLAAVLPAFDAGPARRVAAAAVRYVYPARDGPPTATERRAMLMIWTS